MFRSIWRKLNKLSNSNLYIFIIFLIRIIVVPLTHFLWFFEPFIKIRIFRGEIGRIGHLCAYFEVLIRTKEINLSDKKQLNIFVVPNNPANKTLYKMWKRNLIFIESNKLDFIYHLCSPWLKKLRHFGPSNIPQGALPQSKPTLRFTGDENIAGKKLIKKMGIESDDWFVCLHSRSSSFLKKKFSNKDFSYHDLRDSSFEKLDKSVKLITKLGGKCLRMSNGENKKLNKKLSKNVIDYANKWHSDFMDVYLPSNCKFFLGGPSGLLSVSHIFNIPVACTNCWPVSKVSIPSDSLFIPKLMWNKEKKRFLSYKEIKEYNLDKYRYASDYKSLGIEVIENDADDIELLTRDILDMINNNKLSDNDENYRDKFMNKYFTVNKFMNKYNKSYEGFKNSGKISWRFLNKHSFLMDK